MKRKIALTLAAAAGAALIGSTPAFAAGGENAVASASPSVKASYNCYGIHSVNGGHGWAGGCSVASGEIRTITYCSDGSNRVGGWIYARPNPWFVSGDCGSGAYWTRVDAQSRG